MAHVGHCTFKSAAQDLQKKKSWANGFTDIIPGQLECQLSGFQLTRGSLFQIHEKNILISAAGEIIDSKTRAVSHLTIDLIP